MSTGIELSVVIAAYNEEENLRVLLPRLGRVLAGIGVAAEIIIVDTTKPRDNTAEACAGHNVICIRRQPDDTYGSAIRTGIAHAQGTFVLFMDADGSHTPEFIPKMYAQAPKHDVVIASRYIEGGYTENPRILIFMSYVVNVIYAVVLGIKCKDVSNSFKIYRRELISGFNLKCNNFDIVEELLYKVIRANRRARIIEIPFTFKKRMFGTTKRNLLQFMLSYLFTILRLRFRT